MNCACPDLCGGCPAMGIPTAIPKNAWSEGGEHCVGVASGRGGAMLPWGGEVAKKLSLLEQGGSMWGFKIPK